MKDLRERYFRLLGIDPNDNSDDCRRKRALLRAYELRSFEIEHYWKRAAYFWGFQVAIFAALGFLWKSETSGQLNPISVALSALGFLTALAGSFSCRGSKFWQENWEYHIDMLEDPLEGALHKTVWLPRERESFSVSRLNLVLSYCFVVFWILVAVYVGGMYLSGPPFEQLVSSHAVVGIFFAFAVLGAVGLYLQKTDLRKRRQPPEPFHRPAPDEL